MTLAQGSFNKKYTVLDIESKNGMKEFLFTLGCYCGEEVTIISKISSSFIINVKDARYSIDEDLAKSIRI